jgi:hypothetical protein
VTISQPVKLGLRHKAFGLISCKRFWVCIKKKKKTEREREREREREKPVVPRVAISSPSTSIAEIMEGLLPA